MSEELTYETFASFHKGGIIQLTNGGMMFPNDKEIVALITALIVKLYGGKRE